MTYMLSRFSLCAVALVYKNTREFEHIYSIYVLLTCIHNYTLNSGMTITRRTLPTAWLFLL